MMEEKKLDHRSEVEKIPSDTPKEKLPFLLENILRTLAQETDAIAASILGHVIKKRFSLTHKDITAYEKTLKEYRREEQIRLLTVKEAEIQTPKILSDNEKNEARKILNSPTLLFDILEMIRNLGGVGEERMVLIHYLALTSRLLRKPISITVKGDSSAGKSYSLGKVMKLFAKSEYIDITDATAQSFYYMKADRFKNKMIVLFEKHGGDKADYAIRTLQTEGKLKIHVTVKNPSTGEFETKEIEKEGPTGFITTTTESLIHAENETRNISVFPDQGIDQTFKIYKANEAQYLGIETPSDDDLRPWQNAQMILEQMRVLIPFAPAIRNYFPKEILRTRRDHAHFLALIEVSALLHQVQRKRIEKNSKVYVEATMADYEIARIIGGEFISKSIYELPPKTIEVIEEARAFEGSSEFTISELAKQIGWNRDTVDKWMKPGISKGYFIETQEARGSRGAKYTVEQKVLPKESFLPSCFEIFTSATNLHDCYDPITGQQIQEIPTAVIKKEQSVDEILFPPLNPYAE